MKVIITGGCGGMGRFLVRAVARLKNIESITIADLAESSAKSLQANLIIGCRALVWMFQTIK